MKRLLLLGCLLTMTLSFSQNDEAYVDQLTREFTNKLQEREIPSYMATKHYCSGRIEMFLIDGKMCTTRDTYYEVYIFWEEADGTPFVKKIDNCGLYQSIELPNNEVLYLAFENLSTIENEEVKPYKSETYTGKPELRKEVQPCFRSLSFKSSEDVVTKSFNLFDISNDSDGKNLNYDYNHALSLVIVSNFADETLQKLTFTRQ
ncbi:MAG: hypothetical protein R2786_08895 [Flavobacteriaceae bacterium]